MKAIFYTLILLWSGTNVWTQNSVSQTYFAFDVSKLTDKNKTELDSLILKIKTSNIILLGYADVIGSKSYNINLSNKRVNTVKQYLLANGILASAIQQAKGLGELKEFKNRAKNRRIDIFYGVNPLELVNQLTHQEAKSKNISDLKIGESLVLENMEFIPGRHYLKEYAKPTLVKLLKVLTDNPTLKIEIHGHICCDYSGQGGMDKDTQTRNLSENRAKYIYDYLINNKINKNRLNYKGFGTTRPLVKEITEADQQRNRRVEILIVEK